MTLACSAALLGAGAVAWWVGAPRPASVVMWSAGTLLALAFALSTTIEAARHRRPTVDGRLLGPATFDESASTGEPAPVDRPAGDEVRSGVVNDGGPVELVTTTAAASSTYAGLVRLREQAQATSAPFVRAADRWALIFVPVMLVLAGVGWLISGDPVRAVAALVVATPCPLLLAAPIAIMSGLSRSARLGVVVKGGAALERLADGAVVVSDTTGTLTFGRPTLTDGVPRGTFDGDEALRLAAGPVVPAGGVEQQASEVVGASWVPVRPSGVWPWERTWRTRIDPVGPTEGDVVDGTSLPKRPTLSDVARRAGLSKSTASLVFQGSPLVARATRERILAAADEMAYVYNRRAASMRTSRSHTVGLLIPGLANPFFGALVQAVEEELAPSGYTLLLANTLEDNGRQAGLIRTFLEYRVDGVLVVPAIGTKASAFDFLKKDGTPTVVLTRHVPGLKSDWVGSDDSAGGALAASHLLQHGCARLAYFGGPEQAYARSQRSDAFAEAVRSHGAELDERWCVGTATSSSAGYEAACTLLQAADPPEGIACHSDAIAFGLIRALTERGHTVGEAVRVVGFDDVEHARMAVPSLSSISVSSDQMGRSAARLLVSRTQGLTAGQIMTSVIEPSLRARESCGCQEA